MSEESIKPDGTPIVSPVAPANKKSGAGNIDLSTADLSTLRSAFETALAERSAIDSRIAGLKKAISLRLKEFQSLNDAVSNEYSSRKSTITLPTVNWGKVWSFAVSWVIPAVILFVLLWFGVKGLKGYYTAPKTDKIPIEQSMIPGHNVWMDFGQEDEQWS